jgi:hypothetical protein
MKTYKWTTEKGNKIELTVGETILDETADGTKYGEEIFKSVEKIKMNGQEFDGQFETYKAKDIVSHYANGKEIITILPADIVDKIWPERKAKMEALERSFKVDQEYEKHYNDVMNALNKNTY